MATSSIFASVEVSAEAFLRAVEASRAHRGKTVKVDVREPRPEKIKLMFARQKEL